MGIPLLVEKTKAFFINRKKTTVLFIILTVGAFYLCTLRPGHNWGGDFSIYIHHAKNIVEGKNYKDTGYIYNPLNPIAPRTEPPVFPLLLVPAYALFKLNLTAMKVEIIFIFLLSLYLIFKVFRDEISWPRLVVLLLLTGFHPYFWGFKDNVLSDIPFFFFTFLSLLFIKKAYDSSQRSSLWLKGLLAGIAIYLAYGTRAIGIVLLPCFLLYDLMNRRKISSSLIAALSVFSAFWVIQTMFFHSAGSNLELFVFNPKIIAKNLSVYKLIVSGMWYNGYSKNISIAVSVFTGIFAFAGFLRRAVRRVSIFELFFVFYLIPVVVWPYFDGPRFLFPLFPLYIFYAFEGARTLSFLKKPLIEKGIACLLSLVMILSCIGWYTKAKYSPLSKSVMKEESRGLFNYIKKNTNRKDTFIFIKPRVLALFTERRCAVYPLTRNPAVFWEYLKSIDTDYIVVSRVFFQDISVLYPFVLKNKSKVRNVYTNPDFKIFKIIKR